MKKKGLLIVISGPAGVGKGTVCSEITKRRKDLKLSISTTTRNPRGKEQNGVDYNFVSKEEFENLIKEDKMLEYVQVFNNYYGTSKDWVLNQIEEGNDILLEIEILGAEKVKQIYKDAILIFMMPPSMEELEYRIKNRNTDSKEQIEIRLKRSKTEISKVKDYNYYVVNDEVDDTVEKINHIIEAEKLNAQRYANNAIDDFIKNSKGDIHV